MQEITDSREVSTATIGRMLPVCTLNPDSSCTHTHVDATLASKTNILLVSEIS